MRLAAIFVVFPLCVLADGPAPLFETHEPLAITLEGPFAAIAKDKNEEPPYHDAVVRLADAEPIPLRIRARGNNRRKSITCQFPPLRLNFSKDTVAGTVFAGQDKLKLVTHCRRKASHQQYVLREYLTYRIYNQLTDYSFRVRPLEITYVDTDGGQPLTRTAFVIEDRDALAERTDTEVADVASVKLSELDAAAENLFSVFQYMVGNTDWAATRGPLGEDCCHNAILLTRESGRYIPVGYDFDNAGLVDAPYAVPSEKLPIDRVTQRLYRGFCRPEVQLRQTLAHTVEQRDAIMALVRDQDGLDNNTQARMTRYLDRYFSTFENDRQRRRAFKCR